MSLLNDREEQDHVQADKNIWNDNGGIPKAAQKNIRLILKSGKIQLGTKHTAFEKSSSSYSSEGESSSGAKKGLQESCRKDEQKAGVVGSGSEDKDQIRPILTEKDKSNVKFEETTFDQHTETEPSNAPTLPILPDADIDATNMDGKSSQKNAENSEEFKVTSSTDLDIPDLDPQRSQKPDCSPASAIDAIKSSYGGNSSPTESDQGVDFTKVGKVFKNLGSTSEVRDKNLGTSYSLFQEMSPDVLKDFQKWYESRYHLKSSDSRDGRRSRRDRNYERYRDRSSERRYNYRERSRSRGRRRDRERSRERDRQRERWRSRSRSRERRRERDRSRDRNRERDRGYGRNERDRSKEREREKSSYKKNYTFDDSSNKTVAKAPNQDRNGNSDEGDNSTKESADPTNILVSVPEKKWQNRSSCNSSTPCSYSNSSSSESPSKEINPDNSAKPIFKKLPNPDEVLGKRSSPKKEIEDCDSNTTAFATDNPNVPSSQLVTFPESSINSPSIGFPIGCFQVRCLPTRKIERLVQVLILLQM